MSVDALRPFDRDVFAVRLLGTRLGPNFSPRRDFGFAVTSTPCVEARDPFGSLVFSIFAGKLQD